MTILVTYASRSGSTAEIAEAIGATLTHQGLSVDVQPMTEVTGVAQYQAIVAGSAVRQQQWLPEAMQFLEAHQHELAHKPVAIFEVCMALATQKPARYQRALQAASAWMAPARQIVHPVSEGYFAGVLDLKQIKEMRFRIALGAMVKLGMFSEGDFRDWNAIRNWAEALPEKLLVQAAKVQS